VIMSHHIIASIGINSHVPMLIVNFLIIIFIVSYLM
jgi:hypothetical protein